MREYEKFTLSEVKSGNWIVPIAILKNWFGQDLQDLLDSHKFYSIGLSCSEETYNSFVRNIEHGFQYAESRPFSDKIEISKWYISKKFIEESIGLLHQYMVRLNSSIYTVKKSENKEDLVKKVEAEQIRFEKKDFPTKIKELNKFCSQSVNLEDNVVSLNSVRNCYVHRRGVVSEKDTNSNNTDLIVKWRTVRQCENIKFTNIEKEYKIGSTIIFSYQECIDTMYTLIGYYNLLFKQCITNIGLSEDDAYYEF